jgi:CheY-like chemotaxis protein
MVQAIQPPGAGPAGQALPGAVRPGILVVDDEAAVRQVLALVLAHAGFEVWVAATGEEAVALYRRHRDAVDVVLLDVRMPGMDGQRTLAALRRLDPGVPCCFMSGDPCEYTEEELLGLGAARVFEKPLPLREAAQVLREVLGAV